MALKDSKVPTKESELALIEAAKKAARKGRAKRKPKKRKRPLRGGVRQMCCVRRPLT